MAYHLTHASKNVLAFLDLIAWSELGLGLLDVSDNGYNVLVGSTVAHPILFESYLQHPRTKIYVKRLGVYSTAAGRYQILARTWDWISKNLQKRSEVQIDFSPKYQDLAAIELIKYRKALPSVELGEIETAIDLCSLEWASFPGGPYGQGSHTTETLLEKYEKIRGDDE